jgi:hypothetical protein
VEASGQLLGYVDRVLRRLCEVGAAADLLSHSIDDGGMSVAGQTGPVAAVQVDVFVSVDVEDFRTPAREPSARWRRSAERGWRSTNKRSSWVMISSRRAETRGVVEGSAATVDSDE